MKNLFTSLNGAIALSFAALLIELFRGFIDSMFVYSVEFKGMELILAVVYTFVFGVWGAGLFVAREGKRWGIMAAFVIGLLFWMGEDWLTTLPVLCPNGCNTIWSNIAALAGLLIGGLALFALGLQIWRKAAAVTV
jgi:hypothetical protein